MDLGSDRRLVGGRQRRGRQRPGQKLLGGRFGAETGWLYPLALLTLAYGLVRWRRAPRTDPVRGGLVLWGIWLLTFGAIYTAMGTVPHTAYIASLAPPLAALGAAGIVLGWRAYRAGGRTAWLLPAAVPTELAWAGWTTAAVGLAATAVLLVGLLTRRGRRTGAAPAPSGVAGTAPTGQGQMPARLVTAALATAVAAVLTATAIWSLSVLDVRYAGTSYDAGAGPAGDTSGGQNPGRLTIRQAADPAVRSYPGPPTG